MSDTREPNYVAAVTSVATIGIGNGSEISSFESGWLPEVRTVHCAAECWTWGRQLTLTTSYHFAGSMTRSDWTPIICR